MRFPSPQGYRTAKGEAWDHCCLHGDRLFPESMLGEYEGKKYCMAHLQAKLATDFDPAQYNFTEDRDGD